MTEQASLWRQRLNNKHAALSFWRREAAEWHLCAVGEILDARDPDTVAGFISKHNEMRLAHLGAVFSKRVRDDDRKEAAIVLEEIEELIDDQTRTSYKAYEQDHLVQTLPL